MAPAAISTSKRKFYRLLEGLSASPSSPSFANTDSTSRPQAQSIQSLVHLPNTDSTSKVIYPANKRARTSLADRPSTSSGITTTARMLHNNPSVRLVTNTDDRRKQLGLSPDNLTQHTRQLPNYAPWSDEQFLGRLQTFADIKIWPPKPDLLDEVQWAKQGWTCDGVNTVACKGCNERVVIQLQKPARRANDPEWGADFDEALLQKYADLIVAGHDKQCLWRSSGCKDDIFRIRVGDVPARNAAIIARYESLLQISESLPDHITAPTTFHRIHPVASPNEPFNIMSFLSSAPSAIFPLADPDSPTDIVPRTPNPNSPNSQSPGSINKIAFALALFGWSGITSYGIPMTNCSHCFIRNGMWLYSQKAAVLTSPRHQKQMGNSTPGTSTTNPTTSSPQIEDKTLQFELDILHREYCPWRNPRSQSSAGQFHDLAGWEILVNTILDQATAKIHTRDALKSAGSTVTGTPIPHSPASTTSTTFSGADPKERRRQTDQQDQARLSRFQKLRDALRIKRTSKAK